MAYIDKDSAIRTALDMCVKVVGHGITQFEAVDIADAFENIPIPDVVEVVRCKDCIYGEIDDEDFPDQYLCHAHGSDWNEGNHFCSNGERKDM